MKNIIAVLLLLAMALCLCACGQGNTEVTTEAPTEETTEAQTEETTDAPAIPEGMASYQVTVVDEGGNPVVGAFVQICKDDCFPGSTDENGVATFTRPETEGYKISFVSMPAGYELVGEETEFYYEGDAKEMTITLKAVA